MSAVQVLHKKESERGLDIVLVVVLGNRIEHSVEERKLFLGKFALDRFSVAVEYNNIFSKLAFVGGLFCFTKKVIDGNAEVVGDTLQRCLSWDAFVCPTRKRGGSDADITTYK